MHMHAPASFAARSMTYVTAMHAHACVLAAKPVTFITVHKCKRVLACHLDQCCLFA